jgi:hypothetical protein
MKHWSFAGTFLLIIFGCGVTTAQSGDWSRVTSLPQNSPLIVRTEQGKNVAGYLITADDDAIRIMTKSNRQTFTKASIKEIHKGVEKHKVPLWGRIAAGTAVFFGAATASYLILRPDKVSDDINARDLIGIAAGTAATSVTVKQLRKLKKLKRGDLIYKR